MIPRQIRKLLTGRLGAFPAVALVGPRQCGKTTLARSLGGRYFDLEQEPDRLRLDLEWNELTGGRKLIVLDEAQAWPVIFPRLRGAIDRDRRRNGRFLLLGSVSPSLMVQVSESLAGRLALLELTPLLVGELPSPAPRARSWFRGGFPDGGVLDPRQYPHWQLDYIELLTRRDLPTWGLPAKPQVTDRLLRMIAALHGQIWNASRVGQSLDLSYKTINSYLDFLVGAFLIRRLEPYQLNIRKRLVKAPRIYWRDTGLLHALLTVPDQHTLLAQPWVGASWEGYVIEQAIGVLLSRGVRFQPYFFRTSDQHELDLVLDFGSELWTVEIKLTTSPSPADADRLNRVSDLIRSHRRFLVTRVHRASGNETCLSCDLPAFLRQLELRGT